MKKDDVVIAIVDSAYVTKGKAYVVVATIPNEAVGIRTDGGDLNWLPIKWFKLKPKLAVSYKRTSRRVRGEG